MDGGQCSRLLRSAANDGCKIMGILLLVVLVLLLMGGLPRWNHSRQWGYGPSGVIGLLLAVVLILVVLGHIPHGF